MNETVVMLVDNGSRRAAATHRLREIARQLSTACGDEVHPVSLQHADRIPVDELDGRPADVFRDFVQKRVVAGQRRFLVLPLFFGRSRALTSYIPGQVDELRSELGAFQLNVADTLVPLPGGEPRIADILAEHVSHARVSPLAEHRRVIVVDHGSPLREVTAARESVVEQLRERLPSTVRIEQAVMEQPGARLGDFSGSRLDELLDRIAISQPDVSVAVAMMFLLPGRHAGPGGDVAAICDAAMHRDLGLQVSMSPLVGEHPLLIDILKDRLREATSR